MNTQRIVTSWYVAAGLWAHFTKPALFSALDKITEPLELLPCNPSWAPIDGHTALILVLPANESIGIAVALGKLNWSVIPMFNLSHEAVAPLIDAAPIVQTLRRAAEDLPKTPGVSPVFCWIQNAMAVVGALHLLESSTIDGLSLPIEQALTGHAHQYPLFMQDSTLTSEIERHLSDADKSDDSQFKLLKKAMKALPNDLKPNATARERALSSIPWTAGQEPFQSTVEARKILGGSLFENVASSTTPT